MLNFDIDSNQYQNTRPFPYAKFDGVLNQQFAKEIQAEILSLDEAAWDRYDNPFEQKYTLRDKYNFPPLLTGLFTHLESDEFIEKLSNMSGYKLYRDETRNFWGVHKYKGGDRLDIHVDAGIHPTMKKKKQLTLGLYLSSNWDDSYGCALEIWKGDNAGLSDAKLHEKVESIMPLFNRLVLFTCNDYAWHGNPEPAACPDPAKRIFLTMSYMSDNMEDNNKRMKAFFIARPEDPSDPEKDKLRLLRADPEKYKEVYRV
jgi:hypothetical protein